MALPILLPLIMGAMSQLGKKKEQAPMPPMIGGGGAPFQPMNQQRPFQQQQRQPFQPEYQKLLGSFQSGTDYVPKTGPYWLHQGEAVFPATPQMPVNDRMAPAPMPPTQTLTPITGAPNASVANLPMPQMQQQLPQQNTTLGLTPERWGQISSILGRAAGALGQSNVNTRTGEVSTWGGRLGNAMAENREQEYRSQGIAADSSYRSAVAQRMQREEERQTKQDALINQISQNPEFQKSITETTGLPPEFSQLVIQGLSVPEISTLLRNPDKFPINTKVFDAIGITLPEGTTAGDLKMIAPFLQSMYKPQAVKPVTVMKNGVPTVINANTGEDIGQAPEAGQQIEKPSQQDIEQRKLRQEMQSRPIDKIDTDLKTITDRLGEDSTEEDVSLANYDAAKYGRGIVFKVTPPDERSWFKADAVDVKVVPRPDWVPWEARPDGKGNWFVKTGVDDKGNPQYSKVTK